MASRHLSNDPMNSDSPEAPPPRIVCDLCRRIINDDPAIYSAASISWATMCEKCFASLGVCLDYERGELLPDGSRHWMSH